MMDIAFALILFVISTFLVFGLANWVGLIEIGDDSDESSIEDCVVKNESYVEMIKNNDLNAMKQVISKEVFFKAAISILNSREQLFFDASSHFNDKTINWRESDRWYELSFQKGLSYSYIGKEEKMIKSDVIAFEVSKEELSFWWTLFYICKEEVDRKYAILKKENAEREITRKSQLEASFFNKN